MAGRRITSATSPTEKQAKPSEQTGRLNRRQQSRNNTNNNFNPKLISSQIVALQCFHYLILGLIFQLDHYVFGTSVTIDRIFTDAYLSVWSWVGWIDSSAILISYLFG